MESKWLILQRSKELNINRLQLAKALGCNSERAAMKKMTKIFDEGLWEIALIKPLAKALQINEIVLINSMLEEINRIINLSHHKEIKEFNDFLPYIVSIHEVQRPEGPSWSVGYDIPKKYIKLNASFKNISREEKIKKAKSHIQKHYETYKNGIGKFGKIVYYIFITQQNSSLDNTIFFDINGKQIPIPDEVIAPKEAPQSKPSVPNLPLKENPTKLKELREQLYEYINSLCSK